MTIRDQPHVINNRYSARRGRQIPIKLTGIPIRRSDLVYLWLVSREITLRGGRVSGRSGAAMRSDTP